jgi:hypothetical protein
MTSKKQKQPVVRKSSKKIADARRVRYGSGCAPAIIVRSQDPATADSGAIRFGSGCCPASLRK